MRNSLKRLSFMPSPLNSARRTRRFMSSKVQSVGQSTHRSGRWCEQRELSSYLSSTGTASTQTASGNHMPLIVFLPHCTSKEKCVFFENVLKYRLVHPLWEKNCKHFSKYSSQNVQAKWGTLTLGKCTWRGDRLSLHLEMSRDIHLRLTSTTPDVASFFNRVKACNFLFKKWFHFGLWFLSKSLLKNGRA